jgi:hypothetical protein
LAPQPGVLFVQHMPLVMQLVPQAVRPDGHAAPHACVSGMQALPHLRPLVQLKSQLPFTQTG